MWCSDGSLEIFLSQVALFFSVEISEQSDAVKKVDAGQVLTKSFYWIWEDDDFGQDIGENRSGFNR